MKINILYDGQTITVPNGKTATLKCVGLKAKSDIVISVVDGEGGGSGGETITDLKGTTWLLNKFVDATYVQEHSCDLNFSSNGTNFNSINVVNDPDRMSSILRYDTTEVAVNAIGDYTQYGIDENYRKVTVTGGADATNADLITWFETNGIPYQNVITFTIEDGHDHSVYTYQAESGMTWAEWVESEYNTDGYYIEQESDAIAVSLGSLHGDLRWVYTSLDLSAHWVELTDRILIDGSYGRYHPAATN